MKTFATLALLGLASAIKLELATEQEDVEISLMAQEFAEVMMEMCDTDSDGLCT